jgi:DNA-binding CsgD family transcriptional regulator/tetratricopeptide (TPR) repeat protein
MARSVRSTIFGREAELDAIERFLDGAERPDVPNAALVIDGAPGIGKSEIWREAIARARQRGLRTLSSRPAEAEESLSYSGLADLVDPVYDEVRDDLPRPQQQALEVALLRTPAERRTDPRTTATGFVTLLHALAASGPVILAIDDVQWLDRASARALEFAVRRLPPRVHLLLTQRTDSSDKPPLGLGEELEEEALERTQLGALSLAALYHVIRGRLGAAPSRPLLVRIASSSEGNPFYALEIARALPEDGLGLSGDVPLPLPGRLHEVVAAHVTALSESTREVLLALAMMSRVSASGLAAAFGSAEELETAFTEAEDAEVIVRDETGVRFTHPLLASAVYASASQARRHAMRRRLADIVSDPEERARHAAHAAGAPDEATAFEVERAAELALRRGAQEAAADLYQAAARLTPSDRLSDASRRQLGAAGATLAVGDPAGARELANSALGYATDATDTAEALLLLGQIAWVESPGRQPIEHLERALAYAGSDRRLRGRIHALLAEYSLLDHTRVLEHSDAASDLLDEHQDPSLLAKALLNKSFFSAQLGLGARHDLVERAFLLEERAGPDVEPSRVGLIWLTCMDETDAARARHRLEDQWYRDRGEEGWRAERLAHLALANFYAGAWELAERAIEDSCTTIEQMGQPIGPWGMTFYIRSLIDLHQGRVDRARTTLSALREGLEQAQHPFFAAIVLSALGSLEVASHDGAAASRAFQQMHAHLAAIGTADPIGLRTDSDEIEALVALGEKGKARAVLEHLEWRHATIPRPWTAVALIRARGLVLAAEGDPAGGLEALEALDLDSAARVPLEHARCVLVKGRLHRRLKQRGAAAEVLGDALDRFVSLGALTWEQEARSELARTGLRRPAPGELTPSELRVAELAAAGLRNREIATAAFMSPKTVEANLARVYRKLGIRSRAELGARMTGLQAPGHPDRQM